MTHTDFLVSLESVLKHRRVAFCRAATIVFVESSWELFADDPNPWEWAERFVEARWVEVPC